MSDIGPSWSSCFRLFRFDEEPFECDFMTYIIVMFSGYLYIDFIVKLFLNCILDYISDGYFGVTDGLITVEKKLPRFSLYNIGEANLVITVEDRGVPTMSTTVSVQITVDSKLCYSGPTCLKLMMSLVNVKYH